jgi:RNase P/RNase MRP subunit p29
MPRKPKETIRESELRRSLTFDGHISVDYDGLRVEELLFGDNLERKEKYHRQVRSTPAGLVLRPFPPMRRKRERRRRIHSLPRKLRKTSGLFAIEKLNVRYAFFRPLHGLWGRYTAERLRNGASFAEHVATCVLHGAKVQVSRSVQEALVGLSGIVVNETTNTLVIVTPKHALRVIPKSGSWFLVEWRDESMTLDGDKCLGLGDYRKEVPQTFARHLRSRVYTRRHVADPRGAAPTPVAGDAQSTQDV